MYSTIDAFSKGFLLISDQVHLPTPTTSSLANLYLFKVTIETLKGSVKYV